VLERLTHRQLISSWAIHDICNVFPCATQHEMMRSRYGRTGAE
jgi:hypothetical protein